jgi:hypothetical protein
MKKVILLLIFLPYQTTAQIFENFESGSFQNWVSDKPEHWAADNSGSIDGAYSLHHSFDNPDNGTDRIGISLGPIHQNEGDTKWEFTLRHGYDPSSSNNWAAFLTTDVQPGSFAFSGISGYAIGVNITGSDDSLRLIKIKGSSSVTVLTCKLNWQTDIGMLKSAIIDVTRTPAGCWSVKVSLTNGQVLANNSGTDSELLPANFFGFLYRYTSTKDRLLWIDNVKISGVFYEDKSAPVPVSVAAAGKNSVRISFNEHPADSLLIPSNFTLNQGNAHATKLQVLDPLTVMLDFDSELKNKNKNSVTIEELCDENGNCSEMISAEFLPVWPDPGDIIISEIMVDPSPQVSLPEAEYIELTNRTEFEFNLDKFMFVTGQKYYEFSGVKISKGEILIICEDADTVLFHEYGNVKGLVHFPSLSQEGNICLCDSSGQLIHYVEYDKRSYGSALKAEGGWSLEMIDTQFPFNTDKNWTASKGSPGRINISAGTNRDLFFTGISNLFPEDSLNLRVSFSEPVFDVEGLKNSVIQGNDITQIVPVNLLHTEFIFELAKPFQKGSVYEIRIPAAITDYAGNKIEKKDAQTGLPQRPSNGDLLFNEIMFNPLPGDPDYIELYNCSGKIIDAARIYLVSVNEDASDTSELYQVSADHRCIMPESFFAVTTDQALVIERFPQADLNSVYNIRGLPSMPDDKGHLLLLSRELDIIDEVNYDDKLHYSLLSGHEGIALEKLAPCISSKDVLSWHSASQNAGWGTPGRLNSISDSEPRSGDMISLSSLRITPDDDGNDDILRIDMSFAGISNVVSVIIYDETGHQVKKLVSGVLCGPDSAFAWDATADDGTPVPPGIYVIYITMYDDAGKSEKWKKACTVLRKR